MGAMKTKIVKREMEIVRLQLSALGQIGPFGNKERDREPAKTLS